MRINSVLCYHAVSPDWNARLALSPSTFERQVEMLRRRGLRTVSFTEAATRPYDASIVSITFDDAYLSVFDHALPILEAHGMIATVFVPTGFETSERLSWPGIDGWLDGPHADELEPMRWDALRELAGRGWEIGAHTRSHPRLSSLAGDPDALDSEIAGSRADCERELGTPCTSLAYPYGDYTRESVAAARRAGLQACAALPSDLPTQPSALEYPRTGVFEKDGTDRFALKLSPLLTRIRQTPVWHRARRGPKAQEASHRAS